MNRVAINLKRFGGMPHIEHTTILVHEVIKWLEADDPITNKYYTSFEVIDSELIKGLFERFYRLCHESLTNLLDYYRGHREQIDALIKAAEAEEHSLDLRLVGDAG